MKTSCSSVNYVTDEKFYQLIQSQKKVLIGTYLLIDNVRKPTMYVPPQIYARFLFSDIQRESIF